MSDFLIFCVVFLVLGFLRVLLHSALRDPITRSKGAKSRRSKRSKSKRSKGGKSKPRKVAKSKRAHNWVIVDGSNVMYWDGGTPKIETVRKVVLSLEDRGYTPGVFFDANAGYLLAGSYKHDRFFGRDLDLPTDQVMVVPKGTPADPYILRAARDFKAPVVTNDRFRDWASDFPEVRRAGVLISGRYEADRVVLALGAQNAPMARPAARA